MCQWHRNQDAKNNNNTTTFNAQQHANLHNVDYAIDSTPCRLPMQILKRIL